MSCRVSSKADAGACLNAPGSTAPLVASTTCKRAFDKPGWESKLTLANSPLPRTMKEMKRKADKVLSYSVFYEQAEGGYVAFVPSLPGCHTQGETLEETERNVREAVALYLESLIAHGEPVPEEGSSFQGRVTVPVSLPV